MALNVIMLGPPGAGKGTQAERLSRELDLPKVSTGDILREAVHDHTPLGRSVQAAMDAGKLVSDEVMIDVVRERLSRPDAEHGFILDGFPRTVPQARAFDAMMRERGPVVILNVVVPTEVLVTRTRSRRICAECGSNAPPNTPVDGVCGRCGGPYVQRADDSEAVVRERLRIFEQQTEPIIQHYARCPTFFTIDGNQPPDRVAADLRAALESVALAVSRRRPDGNGRRAEAERPS